MVTSLVFFKDFFAMKVINISKLNAKDVEHAETEVRNLKTLSHQNLVRYVSDFRKVGSLAKDYMYMYKLGRDHMSEAY